MPSILPEKFRNSFDKGKKAMAIAQQNHNVHLLKCQDIARFLLYEVEAYITRRRRGNFEDLAPNFSVWRDDCLTLVKDTLESIKLEAKAHAEQKAYKSPSNRGSLPVSQRPLLIVQRKVHETAIETVVEVPDQDFALVTDEILLFIDWFFSYALDIDYTYEWKRARKEHSVARNNEAEVTTGLSLVKIA
ncbi:uncharacterized protein I206_102246 [Kwoniella pini CBS 10737]|uniref:Uncharacterized protein n=1 Tax=Kwoniella pini CBS 10737 TaxID=1296096 RepID=A0A1B9HSY7_9TREE|nr:uncharacterized protein I206_07616 [Kwoniella pini CBS 10737]OCF46382.1 hypothetical protein I206_07616 [Kwoniella pini CBS 10737]